MRQNLCPENNHIPFAWRHVTQKFVGLLKHFAVVSATAEKEKVLVGVRD